MRSAKGHGVGTMGDSQQKKNKPKNEADSPERRDISYYLDARDCDERMTSQLSLKSGRLLALREKLLAIPDREFEVAMCAIEQIVASLVEKPGSEKTKDQRLTKQELREFADRASKGNSTTNASPSSVSQVSRV